MHKTAYELRISDWSSDVCSSDLDKSYNAIRKVATRREAKYAQKHGLAAPVDVYPLYENATRAAWSESLEDAQFESAEIWSRFSEVAAANEGAWIRKPASPADITRIHERNRPIAFPSSKPVVANP